MGARMFFVLNNSAAKKKPMPTAKITWESRPVKLSGSLTKPIKCAIPNSNDDKNIALKNACLRLEKFLSINGKIVPRIVNSSRIAVSAALMPKRKSIEVSACLKVFMFENAINNVRKIGIIKSE